MAVLLQQSDFGPNVVYFVLGTCFRLYMYYMYYICIIIALYVLYIAVEGEQSTK